jgi:CubicO group peptidase (beta-lactamase class C family)
MSDLAFGPMGPQQVQDAVQGLRDGDLSFHRRLEYKKATKEALMKPRAALLALVLTLALAATAWGQALPTAKPEQVGLSAERLDRIRQVVSADVEKGRLPGAVVLVARKGRVAYHEAFGFRDKTANAPMAKDDIFRIYSMTKPFTSVAIMMLAEEGRLNLSDPVSRFLPQLTKLPVGVERFDPVTGKQAFQTVPADREMTIQDLLRHTSGLTYGVFGKSGVKDLYTKAGVDGGDHSNAELIDKLAKVPLHYQPGTTWEYSRSTDVLGRVVEVVTGATLGRVLEERIFKPLRMPDSGFWVAEAKHARIAQPLAADPDSGRPVKLLDVTGPRKYESGGGGGVSTAMDYARFSQMLLNRGALDGTRLLGRKSVELMTTDQLGDIKFPRTGWGFGPGFAVRRTSGGATELGSAGEYNWGGFGGTYFWVDPKEELVAVWMAQGPGQRPYYRQVIKSLVMQALVD